MALAELPERRLPPVTTRSYHQHCSLARALDLVGERWTLLIVRDLLAGPQRYKDLLQGLPGIGTNLLAARLKRLVALGLVERDDSVGRGVYALTDAGRGLEPALVALARFGALRLGANEEGALWRPVWTPLALRATFRPDQARGVDEAYEFRVDGEVFHARVRDGDLETGGGPAEAPALVVTTDGETFLAMASGALAPRDAVASPRVEVTGDLATLERCQRLFGLA